MCRGRSRALHIPGNGPQTLGTPWPLSAFQPAPNFVASDSGLFFIPPSRRLPSGHGLLFKVLNLI